MNDDNVSNYAKSIFAVGTGSTTTYVEADVEKCKTILKHVKSESRHVATGHISSILNKQNIPHDEVDLTKIYNKLRHLLTQE